MTDLSAQLTIRYGASQYDLDSRGVILAVGVLWLVQDMIIWTVWTAAAIVTAVVIARRLMSVETPAITGLETVVVHAVSVIKGMVGQTSGQMTGQTYGQMDDQKIGSDRPPS